MINNVTLVGRLTKDIELQYVGQQQTPKARFTLAVNRPFKDANGENKADFIQVTVWRKQAENAANYLRKGSMCGVVGRIETGSYQGQDGNMVYTTEVNAESVQFLDSKNSADQQQQGGYQQQQQGGYQQQGYQQQGYQQQGYQQNSIDDQMPF